MSLKKHDRTSFSFFLSFSNKNKILFRRVPFFPLFETPGTRATRSPLNRTKVSVTGGITFELVKRGNIVKEALWDEDLKRTRTREEEPVYANYVFANNSRTAAWKGKHKEKDREKRYNHFSRVDSDGFERCLNRKRFSRVLRDDLQSRRNTRIAF